MLVQDPFLATPQIHLFRDIIIDSLSFCLSHYTQLPGKVPQETFVGCICLQYKPLPHCLTRGTWQWWSLFLISCELQRGWALQCKASVVRHTSLAFLISHPPCSLQSRHTGCHSGALMCQGPALLHIQDLCNSLFLWQGNLCHPPPLSLFLIILRSQLQCYFLKKLSTVS